MNEYKITSYTEQTGVKKTMFKNLFFHENNRNIYKGTKEGASPIREAYAVPTAQEARSIDRQEAQIKQLEKQAKTDIITRFYIYGY